MFSMFSSCDKDFETQEGVVGVAEIVVDEDEGEEVFMAAEGVEEKLEARGK